MAIAVGMVVLPLDPSGANDMSYTDFILEKCLINGEWRAADSGAVTSIYDPGNGERIGSVPNMGEAECDQAIAAADAALPLWRAKTAAERAHLMRKLYQLMIDHKEDLATLLTREQGKPLAEARSEITYGASFIEWFAEEGKRAYGNVIPSTATDRRILVLKQAVGVVAAITPWNFPVAMITRKLGPALAAGCTIIIKPAPTTPFSALAIGKLCEIAGIPKGVVNIVTGKAEEIGAKLTASKIVRKISFTGSTAVGRQLLKLSADSVKKCSMELGGNAPFIIFDDADIDAAVEGALISKFRNNGQTCVCTNRFYVQKPVYEEFIEKFAARVAAMKVGYGLDEHSEIGPLIDERALEKVEAHLADALQQGARLLIGGQRHEKEGFYYQPTVIADVTPKMKIAREETFGPLAGIIPFDTEAEVIHMANDTEFGLASYLYSQNLSRVWRVSEALEAGMVGINTGLISTEVAPFGGVKQSGLGREGSHYGLDDYLELKYLAIGI